METLFYYLKKWEKKIMQRKNFLMWICSKKFQAEIFLIYIFSTYQNSRMLCNTMWHIHRHQSPSHIQTSRWIPMIHNRSIIRNFTEISHLSASSGLKHIVTWSIGPRERSVTKPSLTRTSLYGIPSWIPLCLTVRCKSSAIILITSGNCAVLFLELAVTFPTFLHNVQASIQT